MGFITGKNMIENVVFDFGQVLIKFDPDHMVGRYVTDAVDAALLSAVVFDRLYWDKLDAGTLGDAEAVAMMQARLPDRLKAAASDIYYNWIYNIPEIEGMREVVELAIERGAQVFLLSNISRYFAQHADEIPILSLIENRVFSSVCGFVKPSAEIYRHLCKKYSLAPEKTLFVDDRRENVEGAEAVGLRGYLFDGDAARLRAYLDTCIGKT